MFIEIGSIPNLIYSKGIVLFFLYQITLFQMFVASCNLFNSFDWDIFIKLLTAFATFLAVIVALFKREILLFIKPPSIAINLDATQSIHKIEQVKIEDDKSSDELYFRAEIKNTSKININNIKIKCNKIKINKDEIYPFDPNYFVWSATHDGNANLGKIKFNLAKGEIHYLDLFHFWESNLLIYGHIQPVLRQLPIGFPEIRFEFNKIYNIEADINIFYENRSISAKLRFKAIYNENQKIDIIDREIIYL